MIHKPWTRLTKIENEIDVNEIGVNETEVNEIDVND